MAERTIERDLSSLSGDTRIRRWLGDCYRADGRGRSGYVVEKQGTYTLWGISFLLNDNTGVEWGCVVAVSSDLYAYITKCANELGWVSD